MLEACFESNSEAVSANCESILPEGQYLRLNGEYGNPIRFDDYAQALEILPSKAQAIAEKYRNVFEKWWDGKAWE